MKDGITQIRDPVHGYIYANELECKIIDSPVFQRLRKIRQLGTAHLTYPGALHTRFEHCIGSMYLAKRAANHLKSQEIINEDMSNELSIAALLHDIGHGPFSHLFEEVLHEKGMTHENITDRIIRETEIADILSRFGVNVKKFSNLCVGTSKNHPRFMNDIIAGFLSVDSMDYLLRDSYFSGVEYGKVDVHRIIDAYEIAGKKLAINKDSVYALESLMLARYEMFRAVYFHKSVRASAVMIIRAMNLSNEELHFTNLDNLDDFLQLTDERILYNISNINSNSENSRLAKKLVIDYTNRKMLKLVFEKIVLGKDEFSTKIFAQRKFRENLAEEIAEKSKIPKSHIFIDVSTATSVPTTSTKESFNEITVLLNNTRKKEFEITKATELPLMNAILGYMNIIRIYTTATYKKKLNTTVKGIFEKEVL
ncbi:MAG TPA: HD domain-containing protein [Nitrososphaerales archaeon]|nr:HD domain-containing protein [Nitrososphaerales archaeon]NSL73619.1 HD domain-containing protein [Nitrososphaerota archaeon]NSL74569.1 HD domain-containing protein [Nitrososphaerota archaeon]NSL75067.1 HD domain-containing protein [Nitrososphaerota archaeon]PXF23979.1 MAG: phosphohydrolase [Nitrososphaerota archaeon]